MKERNRVLVVALVACLTIILGLAVTIQFIRHRETNPVRSTDNSNEIHEAADEEKAPEIEQKKKEADDGYNEVFVAPGSAVSDNNDNETNDGKIGRPKLEDSERNSPEDTAQTGAQPKPSIPEGSEPQSDG